MSEPRWIVVVVGALAFAGYFAIARAVTDLYPFSTHSMYSGTDATQASRIAVRRENGELREVTAFAEWDCASRVDADPRRCREHGHFYHVPYLELEAEAWIAEHTGHRGPAHERVTVVRWIVDLAAIPEPVGIDCEVQSCWARRRR